MIERIGLPVVIRPAYILGGKGTGIATTPDEFERLAANGLDASPVNEILIERSIAGWKEYELEVMRDRADNCVIICSIENLDPMGVHTGDSITVAPAQTLSDVEYQLMRDAAFACIRRVGVETGGSNVQFALDPTNGDMVIIEMNPRVSRSSALASKATGFPIAKIAAKLAVGLHARRDPQRHHQGHARQLRADHRLRRHQGPALGLREVPRHARACSARRCSRSARRWRSAAPSPSRLQKAMRSLEHGRLGLALRSRRGGARRPRRRGAPAAGPPSARPIDRSSSRPRSAAASRVEVLAERTKVDPWFLDQILAIVEERAAPRRDRLRGDGPPRLAAGQAPRLLPTPSWRGCGRVPEAEVRAARLAAGVRATFKTVDTCAAEFEAATPYHYSTYEDEDEVTHVRSGEGADPRIRARTGSGRASSSTTAASTPASPSPTPGFETVMLNCNPETVSTDYDTSDRLYFEPLTLEDALNVIEAEQASGTLKGVIVGLGGQTPLKLSGALPEGLVLGTSPESIDLAEDRERWNALCARLEIPQPAGGTATTLEQAQAIVEKIGYPVLMRPSYVLGGRAMEIVYDDESLKRAMDQLAGFGSLGKEGGLSAERPVLVDRFLEDATEVDVDAIRDVTGEVIIGGVMEHVEEAGVHSGDSACALPPYSLVAGDDRGDRGATPGPSPPSSRSSASSTCSTR